jgi:quercetin dioxygenase-like cupin family protein
VASIQVGEYVPSTTGTAPSCAAQGKVRSNVFLPAGSELWSALTTMGPGSVLSWTSKHGDEAVYVTQGTIRVNDDTCGANDVVIVEGGVPTVLEALTETCLVQFGPHDHEPPLDGAFGRPAADHHAVHLRRAADVPLISGEWYERRLFADSVCPTCRITLFSVAGRAGYDTGSHLHSKDEIIHILKGTLQVGRLTAGPGMGLAVPGSQRYGFRAQGDFYFLNYRRDVATFTGRPGSTPILETELRDNLDHQD